MLAKLVLFLSLYSCTLAKEEADLVKDLPGLIFPVNFKTYSGYLNAGTGTDNANDWQMHYLWVSFSIWQFFTATFMCC